MAVCVASLASCRRRDLAIGLGAAVAVCDAARLGHSERHNTVETDPPDALCDHDGHNNRKCEWARSSFSLQ